MTFDLNHGRKSWKNLIIYWFCFSNHLLGFFVFYSDTENYEYIFKFLNCNNTDILAK